MNIDILYHDDKLIVAQSKAGNASGAQSLYGGFNLGLHVGDAPKQVLTNRAKLLDSLNHCSAGVIKQLAWLNQTHSCTVVTLSAPHLLPAIGDALISNEVGVGLAIMTADCVPVAIFSRTGGAVACVHAGWQGLAKGIIKQTLLRLPEDDYQAYIGACISGMAYEMEADMVKDIVHTCHIQALTMLDAHALWHAIVPSISANKAHLDVAALARLQLQALGVPTINDTVTCSYQGVQTGMCYSHRHATHQQQPATGRMAMVVAKIQ